MGGVAFLRDVSEARRIENMRRDFVANVSHELKTPIGALGLLAETMAGEEDAEMLRRLADRVLHESERLERTVEDLLDLSILEAQESPERELIAVDLLMADAAERMASTAEAADIPIELTEPAGDILVACDRRQVTSALFNLLDNAVKYSEEGGKVEFSAPRSRASRWRSPCATTASAFPTATSSASSSGSTASTAPAAGPPAGPVSAWPSCATSPRRTRAKSPSNPRKATAPPSR